jgi:hypothetical protein
MYRGTTSCKFFYENTHELQVYVSITSNKNNGAANCWQRSDMSLASEDGISCMYVAAEKTRSAKEYSNFGAHVRTHRPRACRST